MYIDWLIGNTKNSRGFISQRVQIVTYMAISQLFGTAVIKNHGKTDEGRSIGQILVPMDITTISHPAQKIKKILIPRTRS